MVDGTVTGRTRPIKPPGTIDDETDERVPTGARLCIKMLVDQLLLLNTQVLENDRQIRSSARSSEVGRRLMEIHQATIHRSSWAAALGGNSLPIKNRQTGLLSIF
ncbi:MAG: hypothetical protein ACI9MJ_002488 [Alphaproteobacteria bacterium]|jgi:hypothetical protein